MNNERATTFLFFDRLPLVHRTQSNGKPLALPGSLPFSIQILNESEEKRTNRAEALVGVVVRINDLNSTPLLEARIDHDINHVSVDGKTVTVAFSCLIRKNTRFYTLSFFDSAAAQRFCSCIQSFLPSRTGDICPLRLTYDDLVRQSKAVEELRKKKSNGKDKDAEVEEEDDDDEGDNEEGVDDEEGEDDDKEEVVEVLKSTKHGKKKEQEMGRQELNVEEDSEEIEVLSDHELSDNDTGKKEESRRKRKRLDPEIEDSLDPIHILNKEFEDQFGASQCTYF